MNVIRKLKNFVKSTRIGKRLIEYRRFHNVTSKEKGYAAIEYYIKTPLSSEEKKKIYADMLECNKKFGFSFDEYFLMELMGKTDVQRNEFVSDYNHIKICEACNLSKNQYIFDNKEVTAERFAKFFKRDYVVVEKKADVERLKNFIAKYFNVVVKPLDSAGGDGVKLFFCKDVDIDKIVNKIVKEYCAGIKGGAIVEEVIVQAKEMSILHPQSVNTIRVPTFRMDDRTIIFHPFFRVGRGDSFIDNAGAGGIICALDAKTGKVLAAADKKGHRFEVHPESKVNLVGYQIPRWEEAIEFVKQLVNVVPSNRYTGWDIALTDDGWVLVEANARGQWGVQIALKQGFRTEVESYMKELGIPREEWTR